ncbi:MAG: GAF domain-containing protein, partial [Anaerolineae bacterium]|nr:GAF domain-containing protein [Anaerolineae bacterium]
HHIPVEIDMTLVHNQQRMPTELQLIVRDIRQRQLVQATLETRLERFSLLHAVDAEINHTLESDVVMAIALRAAVDIAGAEAGCIALTEEHEIVIRHKMGSYPDASLGRAIAADNLLVQQAIQEKRAQYHPQGIQHPDLPDVQAAMIFPLLAYDHLIGVMFLGANNPAQFSEDNFEFIQLIATRLAIALENARLHEDIQNQVRELERLNTELRDTERLKTDMLRIANHDLKNPLGIVRGYVSIFEIDLDRFPPEYAEFIESMRNSLDRMETIMDDFLTVEAFKVRAAMAEMATVNLIPLVERAVKEYSEQANDNHQSLTLDVPDGETLFVVGDEAQLYEATTNLIGNALKYTPEGGSIQVSLREDAGDVIFKVEDNGYGIPAERQSNLFNPFFRSRTQETVTIEGTGLGLHLVKNIIERHKGEIIFHSVYREGSTFGFRLKRLDAAE